MGLFQKYPLPRCKEVKLALKRLGFEFVRQNGSHEQYAKTEKNGTRRLVTVDCPKQPFADDLVKSMASQAGVSKRDFLKLCFDKKNQLIPESEPDVAD